MPVHLGFFYLHAFQRIEIIGDHEPPVAAEVTLVAQQLVQHQAPERGWIDVHLFGFQVKRPGGGKENVIRQLRLDRGDKHPLKRKHRLNRFAYRGCRQRLLAPGIAEKVQCQHPAVVEQRAKVLEHLHA